MSLWFWIGVALLVGIGEVMTTGLFLGTVAVAAAITALTARWLPWKGRWRCLRSARWAVCSWSDRSSFVPWDGTNSASLPGD
jgi:membrane protein implicated in regulation of membrane protease activity